MAGRETRRGARWQAKGRAIGANPIKF